ncbi:MAG TPA: DUF2252 family protein [Anaerolineaceae bacterium]|nr:DUF2252 family protein [Anaerolineaceae bacterium]
MNIIESTQKYENWLEQRIPIIQEDLASKHNAMREAAFPFLRATFYRWVQLWPEICADLASAPAILSVGDLHVENLGTWRDKEGRLAWGVNDFDEAYPAAYTNDLVRLAASAILASQEQVLAIQPPKACQAILDGYQKTLENHGQPFVLAEQHEHLREWAISQSRAPLPFWQKLQELTPLTNTPAPVQALLQTSLPAGYSNASIVHRVAGLGSLGRQRYTIIADWGGAKIAREAKQLLDSAWIWEKPKAQSGEILYQKIIERSIRSPDPFTSQHNDWLVRRIAPDCSRIELAALPKERDETLLLAAMGSETANIHLGNAPEAAGQIMADLSSLPKDWLLKGSQAMVNATLKDWEDWKKSAK